MLTARSSPGLGKKQPGRPCFFSFLAFDLFGPTSRFGLFGFCPFGFNLALFGLPFAEAPLSFCLPARVDVEGDDEGLTSWPASIAFTACAAVSEEIAKPTPVLPG